MTDNESRRGIGGRPSSATHPVVAVTHLDRHTSVGWSDGQFAGDPDLVLWSRVAATTGVAVRIGPRGASVVADPETPLGAVAAMLDACGGRGVVDLPADPSEIPGWPGDAGCIPDALPASEGSDDGGEG